MNSSRQQPAPKLKNDVASARHLSLDTSPGTGMQGEPYAPLSADAQSSLFFESVEEIYMRVFRELKPNAAILAIAVKYRKFAGVRSSIHLSKERIEVKISDVLETAPAPVTESLARILLGKLLRRPAPESHVHRYRLYLNRKDVRRQILLMRKTRGRKHLSGPIGRFFNLAEIFDRINVQFFDDVLPKPELGWSRGRSRTLLGHFDPSHNAIVISRIFDEAGVPPLAIEYVMFHEMLHVKFPVEHSGIRRCVHTREFRQAEDLYPRLAEAKEVLKGLR